MIHKLDMQCDSSAAVAVKNQQLLTSANLHQSILHHYCGAV